jgi:hypothetical protein
MLAPAFQGSLTQTLMESACPHFATLPPYLPDEPVLWGVVEPDSTMTGGIFLIKDDGKLVEMNEQAYVSEDLLQELLAKYPNLLAGDQIETVAPRRWLLVKREMGIPSESNGAGRWSLDHLFLDQDAIPTLIEVKRSSDTRIRREVVGQMLDYAANAVVYWPVEEMRAQFERTCEDCGLDASGELLAFLREECTSEEFWQRAKTNLQAGKIRMIFVADEIPAELKRIVEFLNEQMDPGEVLAVEIRQFVGEGLKTLVPRVFGQTAEAEKRKSGGTADKRQWDEKSFFDEMVRRQGEAAANVARRLLQWCHENGVRVWWGQGNRSGSFIAIYDDEDGKHHLFGVWTYGRIEFQFQFLLWKPPFISDEQRLEVLRSFRAIPGITFSDDAMDQRPSFPLSVLDNPTALQQFGSAFDAVLAKLKARSAASNRCI